jgi:hypothetical protein
MQESIWDEMLQGAMEQWFKRHRSWGDVHEVQVWNRLIELATEARITEEANR